MRITIYYDLINTIKNVNEDYNVLKIVRNNKKNWLLFPIPEFLIIDIINYKNTDQILTALTLEMGALTLGEYFIGKSIKKDKYYDKSSRNLRLLTQELNSYNLNTNYELLKESKLYDKTYNIKLNEKKLPKILESKYILVPTYDKNNYLKNRSIKQEHILGHDEYILSLDIPEKQKQLVLVKSM